MKALRCRVSIPRYLLAKVLGKRYPIPLLPLSLVDISEPSPLPGWRRVKVRLCGICGSDIALLYGKNSPRLSPFFSFPAVLGHEILGEVDGKRVVVNPNLACLERGLERCEACARGDEGICQNTAEGAFAPGMLGFCRDLVGGWGEWIWAHPDKVHPVPERVPDERAVLTEPLAVALRGLRYLDPAADLKVLVIGAGTIGLIAVKVMRILGYAGEIHVAARYPLQAELAIELGADRVYSDVWDATRLVGAKSYKAIIGPPAWRGGFDVVVDAAGSKTSLQQASWAAREGGKLLLLGSPGEMKHDFSPHWFREVKLLGSYIYSDADFKRAVELLPKMEGIEKLVTHKFLLSDWRKAIRTVIHRRGIKVVFKP